MLAGIEFEEERPQKKEKPRSRGPSKPKLPPEVYYNEEEIVAKLEDFQNNLIGSLRHYRRKIEKQLQKMEENIAVRTKRVSHRIKGPFPEEMRPYPPPAKQVI